MSCNDPCGDHIQINIDSAGQGPVGPPGPAAQTAVWKYYLQPGDTIVSGPDASGTELAYEPASVQVFLNGVLLSDDDYTTDSGDSIVLNEAAVGVNDVFMIHSQVGPTDFDPTNDHALLQSQIDDNRTDIDGLRVDVDQHSQDIADLQADQTDQVVTTADVVTVGTAPFLDSKGDPANQYEANWVIHDRIVAAEGEIANTKQELQALDQGVSDLSQTVTDLSTDVDGISISVATNTVNISKNASDISQLQVDVGNINVPDLGPLDVRVTDLETLTTSHSSDLVGLRTDVDALGAPVDLGPLNDAISDNSVAISKNTTDIASIKAVDAQQSSQIGDLQIPVGNLEAIDHDHSNHALIDQDNVFTVSQTIKDGIKLTGSQAFIECDTGTALSVRNNNFSNAVINVMRSNGDVAISLEASGHIRGVATDSSDPTSAVNVEYLDGIVGGGGDGHDHDDYATKIDLKTEENARILGDQKLADDLAAAILTEKYNDTELRNKIAAEESARAAGDSSLSKKIDTEAGYRQQADDDLQAQIDAVDVSVYATIAYVDATIASAGFATEKFVEDAIDAIDFPEGADLTGYATEEFVTNAIDAIEFPSGTVVSDTPPADPEEGATWYDTGRLELFVFAEGKWMACSPLSDRIDEVDRTAIMRDDAMKKEHDEDSAKQSVINAGVVASLDELFWRDVAIEQGAREDDEKLQAQIDAIEEALPKAPLTIDPIDIGQQTLKITGSRPTGATGEAGTVLMWKAETGGPGSPFNECKFIVPDTSIVDPSAMSVWWKQGDRVQHWVTGGGGWLTNANVLHYSASETSGDTLVDGQPVELYYVDPNATSEDFLDAISRMESKSDDRKLQAEIDQLALGLETLLVQREHGQWTYVGFSGDNPPNNAGEFALSSDDLSASNNTIVLNQEDLKGTAHGFGDVEVGDYVEIVDLDDPASYVLFVVSKKPEGTGVLNVEVTLKDKGQNILIGETCEIRFFAINEQDINLTDLDNRYLKLSGGTMDGGAVLKVNTLEPVNMPFIYYEGDPDNTHAAGLINRYMMNEHTKQYLPTSGGGMSGGINMNTNHILGVQYLGMTGAKEIQEGQVTRLKLDGKVIVKKPGVDKTGFLIQGKVDGNDEGDLFSAYHNSSGLDAVNYQGKTTAGSKNLATCEYVDNALMSSGTPLPQFRLYAGDFIDDWNPGDMALCDASGATTTTLSSVRSVLFHAEDINGKRWARDKNSTGYRRNYSSSLSVLLPDGEQTIFSMSPSHNVLCEIYHITDFEDYMYDMYVIAWTGPTSACLTSSMASVITGDTYLLHVPEIFF